MWPDYFKRRKSSLRYLPKSVTWAYLRLFHNRAAITLIPTGDVNALLQRKGFKRTVVWSRGVDLDVFCPDNPFDYRSINLSGIIALYVGRVSDEKSVDVFCKMDIPVNKVVIGKGDALEELREQYPKVTFLGEITDRRLLARYMAGADVFVFPSLTDTFGLVTIEAMACGTPVAASVNAAGMASLITNHVNGYTDVDLTTAVAQCLNMGKLPSIRESIANRSWQRPAEELLGHFTPI